MGSGVEVQYIYSLSPMQEAMLYQSLVKDDIDVNLRQISFDIKGEIDIHCLEHCLNLLIDKYDIFRTVFVYRNTNKPKQVVLKHRRTSISYIDTSDAVIEDIIEYDKQRGFDLSKDVLIRLTLLGLHSGSYKAVFSFHHIILDGWCMEAVIGELFMLYKARRNDLEVTLEKSYPYRNYIDWIEEQNKQSSLDYWSSYLKHYEHKQVFRNFYEKSTEGYSYNQAVFTLDKTTTERLKEIARNNKVTLNTAFLCLWGILLNKYADAEDLLIGTVMSNRPPEIEGFSEIVGLFLNTIPTRIMLDYKKNYIDLLKDVQSSIISAQEHGYVSLTEILEIASLKSDSIDHIIVFQNHLISEDLNSIGTSGELGFEISNVKYFEPIGYNLGVFVYPGQELEIKINYNTVKFNNNFINNIKRHFTAITKTITSNPLLNFMDICLIDYEEENLLIRALNNTLVPYERDSTIHMLFENQVKKSPNDIAVVFKEKSYTYNELNQSANQIAYLLRSKGVKPDTVVGIGVKRTYEMIIGIIAVLKAGGAYLPIDLDYPAERIKYILKDSGARLLLTSQILTDELEFNGHIIDLSDESIYCGSKHNPVNVNKPKDLAYITYTSGSTGKPKGVMIEHRAVNNFIKGITDIIDFRAKKSILALTTISFDIFLLETILPLTKGLYIIVADEEQQTNPRLLSKLIEQSKVDMLQATPSRIQMLLSYDKDLNCLHHLKEIMLGGESFPINILNNLKRIKNLKIYNMYGPTETTIWSTVGELTYSENINIGRPIANTQAYIVDKNMKLQPLGLAGELCIAGDGLSRGYFNKNELTDEKFIDNPFQKGSKMYRTGDLVRWVFDSNGNASIEFISRLDSQLKIRGYRVEAGEIESRITAYPGIKEAVVISKQDKSGTNYLCAYVTTASKLDSAGLRGFLNKELPYYMIPAHLIEVDAFPHTPNNKIDFNKLQQMNDITEAEKEYEAPEDEIEQKLLKLWQELLGTDKIGVKDNFFELGGHSIKATMLLTHIYKAFGIEIKLRKVLDNLTIRSLKELIVSNESKKYSNITPAGKMTYYPLSAEQKRVFAVSQLDKSNISYNMPLAVMLKGEVDRTAIKTAFAEIIKRHEPLRTSFELVKDKPMQRIYDNAAFDIEYKDVSKLNFQWEMTDFTRPFQLDHPPLIRVRLLKLREGLHMMLIDIHHIIGDETSLFILLKEFKSLFSGHKLQDINLHYKDYSVWQSYKLGSEDYTKQGEYWLGVFDKQISRLKLPLDFERPRMQSQEGMSVYFSISPHLFNSLNGLAVRSRSTMYMILLACLNILLHKYTAQEDIIIGSSISARVHPDLENMVGMLINTIALRNYPIAEKTLTEFLTEVREGCLKAYENRDYQFNELIAKLKLIRDPSRNSLYDVFFDFHTNELERNKQDLAVKVINPTSKTSKFDISLEASQRRNRIFFRIEYCTKLFKENTILRFRDDYLKILNAIVDPKFSKIKDIELYDDLNSIKNPISEGVEFNF